MWKAILKDGTKATELSHKWSDIKRDIDRLSFDYNGTVVVLPPSNEYYQYKSASAALSGEKVDIDSQTIGFRLNNGQKLLLRFHFKINKIDTIIE